MPVWVFFLWLAFVVGCWVAVAVIQIKICRKQKR